MNFLICEIEPIVSGASSELETTDLACHCAAMLVSPGALFRKAVSSNMQQHKKPLIVTGAVNAYSAILAEKSGALATIGVAAVARDRAHRSAARPQGTLPVWWWRGRM